ncbi:hypothetical protein B0H14DRAFT_3426968 [Mycena olivaceomarginata]|nr:hypothetical protein B0H14DRAFT_3426968 [Mycena olivaceomarginata]
MVTILRFWERTIPISTLTFQQRFINIHALNMDGQVVRDSELYFAVHPHASAVLPSFVMAEIQIKVSDEVYYNPLLERMRYWDAMLICIDNILPRTTSSVPVAGSCTIGSLVGIQEAVDRLAIMHDDTKKNFLNTIMNLPSWGEPIDTEVWRYIDSIASRVRGA